MKAIIQFIITGIIIMHTVINSEAQVKVAAGQIKSHELEVLNKLTSPSAVVNMPVSQLLNAPGMRR